MNATKKIARGEYEYRGYLIRRLGYYHPEKRVAWEGIDKNGDGIARGFTKREIVREIDYMIDRI